MNKPMLAVGSYDKTLFHRPSNAHGEWTNWPELHDQKSLNQDGVYTLQHNSPIPKGGTPFFVEKSHPSDGGQAQVTNDPAKARKFRGTYLLHTTWEWELAFTAMPV